MELSFVQAGYALLIMGLPLLWWLQRNKKDYRHLLLRALACILVILAMMQPVLFANDQQQQQVFILDVGVNDSVEQQAQAQSFVKSLAGKVADGTSITLVQLGQQSPLELDQNQTTIGLNTSNLNIINLNTGTSLADALEHALSAIPVGTNASVTVISDGFTTDQHWSQVLAHYRSRQIPVHTLPLPHTEQDVFIADLQVSQARVGENATVTVEIVGNADDLELSLLEDGDEILRTPTFSNHQRQQLQLSYTPQTQGFTKLDVKLHAPANQDSDLSNNQLAAVVSVQAPTKALYLGDRQLGAAQHLQTLVGNSVQLESRDAQSLPSDFNFQHYDLVIQDDLPAHNLSPDLQQSLADAVKHYGTGLFHSGAEAAFGAGGYERSELAKLLPVELKQTNEKKDPSIALAIIIDTSGSMGGKPIQLAKQIARIASRRLEPHDRIGIVEFYGAKHWAIPLQPASNKIEIDRALGRMKAIGGTVLFPAVQEAYYGLKNVNTRYKHILLLTDAGVEDADYELMLRRIAKDNINVSTVLVGTGGHNQIMASMANWGKGRFYAIPDEFSLVDLILKEPSTRQLPAYKRGEFELTGLDAKDWWGDIAPASVPALSGYSKLPAKPDAQVLLQTQGSADPLLASWQYGLGRVTAFTSEPVGAGTRPWQNWPEYGQWLAQALNKTARAGFDFELTLTQKHNQFTLMAQRQSSSATAPPSAQLLNWQGNPLSVPVIFQEKAPGLFMAKWTLEPSQDALVQVQSGTRNQYISALAGADKRNDNQINPSQALDMAKLAKLTSGQTITPSLLDEWQPPTSVSGGTWKVSPLWPYLLLMALMLYLLDLIYRRSSSRIN
jgi:Mg-chelatase subunit ChlD